MTDPTTPVPAGAFPVSSIRHGLSLENLKRSFIDSLFCGLGRAPRSPPRHDLYTAAGPRRARSHRCDRRWAPPRRETRPTDARVVAYLSAEFLLGPHLGNNLVNLGHRRAGRGRRWPSSGWTSTSCSAQEEEPGLGNGGLGRLAACLPRLAGHARDPGHRLRHPLRVRHLRPGDPRRLAGRESPTSGCASATPGRSRGPEIAFEVKFGGHTER